MSDFPYFPLYVSDLLGDDKVIVQDLTQFGAYMRLLCLAWQQKPPASIPSDDAVIAKMLGVPTSEWAGLKPTVIQCWQLRGNRYYNKRLKQVFDEMIDARRKRQTAGQLGGKQRSSNAREWIELSSSGNGDGSGGDSGDSELPSEQDFVAYCTSPTCGIRPEEGLNLFLKLKQRGWKDGSGALVVDWHSYVTRMRKYIEQDRNKPNSNSQRSQPNGNREPWKIKNDIATQTAEREKAWGRLRAAVANKRGSATNDEISQLWRKLGDPKDVTLYDAKVQEVKRLEQELGNVG